MLRAFSCSATIALLSLGLLACDGGGGGSGSGSITTGTLNLDLSDAPVDYAEKVLVQFTGVAVKPSNGASIDISLKGDSQTCQELLDGVAPSPAPEGEITIRCIDLLRLEGTQSASLLQGEILDAGNYNWMRLDVDAERGTLDSIIVLDDGSVESLYVPSGSQSGLKLNTAFTILAGGRHNFVIDFDLRKSVNDPKGFPDYRLKPSLRLIDMAESGNIVGAVETSLLIADGCTGDVNSGDGFAVYVYEGADAIIDEEGSDNAPLTSADVNLDNDTGLWGYTVGFVGPGEYTVAFTCQAADDFPDAANDGIELIESSDSPTTVVVDQDSTVDFS
jgi:hypothetical protein